MTGRSRLRAKRDKRGGGSFGSEMWQDKVLPAGWHAYREFFEEVNHQMKMSEMKDRFSGQPAAILGGGPSLPEDMKSLPQGCILIAVNHHARLLCEPHFMVYNDRPPEGGELEEAVLHGKAIKVSPEPTSDIQLDIDVWTGFYSSNLATWFALWLGCDPVILCGMDCYQGERAYFHEYEDQPHFHYPLSHHINPWVEDAKNKLPGWERVKVMSGPLIGIFEKYQNMGDKAQKLTQRLRKSREEIRHEVSTQF